VNGGKGGRLIVALAMILLLIIERHFGYPPPRVRHFMRKKPYAEGARAQSVGGHFGRIAQRAFIREECRRGANDEVGHLRIAAA
jgi:hypothetical protein